MKKKMIAVSILVAGMLIAGSVSAAKGGDPLTAVWNAINVLVARVDGHDAQIASMQATIDDLVAKVREPWNLTGTYVVYWGGNQHQMVVDTMNTITGEFSGHGTYLDAPGYSWTMTGNLDGSAFTFRITYTETLAGYYVDTTGTIATIGTLSGNGVSSLDENFAFYSASGIVTKN